MRYQSNNLNDKITSGELFVVPNGLEHKPRASDECSILVIEPRNIINTGDAGGAITVKNDVWT